MIADTKRPLPDDPRHRARAPVVPWKAAQLHRPAEPSRTLASCGLLASEAELDRLNLRSGWLLLTVSRGTRGQTTPLRTHPKSPTYVLALDDDYVNPDPASIVKPSAATYVRRLGDLLAREAEQLRAWLAHGLASRHPGTPAQPRSRRRARPIGINFQIRRRTSLPVLFFSSRPS